MPKDEFSRRLHPRLRMIRNGSAVVNGCRSDISTTVVSTRDAVAQRGEFRQETFSLVQAQESARTLDVTPLALGHGRLPARPKLKDAEAASDAFVNVFVQVAPDRGGVSEAGEDRDIASVRDIRELLRESLAGLSRELRGCVVQRGNLISAMAPVSMLQRLEHDPSVGFVSASEPLKLDVPVADRTRRKPKKRNVSKRNLHGDGKDVILGIIDVGGFDFAHPDFLDDAGKTRFISIWDQGGDFRDPPARFDYGTEFQKKHLDAAVKAAKKGGFPATDLEPQSQRSENSHGTHVASIAAGRRGVCPKAEIAAVLVDVPVPEDEREHRQFTFSDTSRIAHAVEYLLDVAMAKQKPISINISLGTNGGAHDGSGGVSRWLDQALTSPGRAICAAAGNAGQEAPTHEGDSGWIMGRIHTSGRIRSRGLDVEIEWAVVGNGIADVSENELEIWYSPQDRFIVSVQPPDEDRWYEALPKEFRENKRLASGTTLSIYNELYHPNNGANYIAVYLSPNLDPDNIRGVKAGVWKVRLRGEEVRDGNFHAWIERDDPVEIGRGVGERFFRFPSFFTSDSNVDSHSISSLACGHQVIAVANVDTELGRINVTSSQGPTRDGRPKPDITAPGTEIIAAKGFSSDGQEWVSMTGTSMASPYVAGVIGLMLAANRDLTSAQCAGILQRTAQPLPGVSFEWQTDSGFGLINPEAAVAEAATFTERRERRR